MSDAEATDEESTSSDETEQESTDSDSDSDGDTGGARAKPGEDNLSDEEKDQLEKERQERLDPENRPVNAEVDNTGREFDAEKEEFTYKPGEEPDGKDRPQAVIGADRPEGVESDVEEEDSTGGTSNGASEPDSSDHPDRSSESSESEDSDKS